MRDPRSAQRGESHGQTIQDLVRRHALQASLVGGLLIWMIVPRIVGGRELRFVDPDPRPDRSRSGHPDGGASTTAATDNRRRRARDVSEFDGARPLMIRTIPGEAKRLPVILLGSDRNAGRFPRPIVESDGPVECLEERDKYIFRGRLGIRNCVSQTRVGLIEAANEDR
jgi:hypothetical protein